MVSARIIAPSLASVAAFVASLAMPVAFPEAAPWIGQLGLGVSLVLAVLAVILWGRGGRKKSSYRLTDKSLDGLQRVMEGLRPQSQDDRSQAEALARKLRRDTGIEEDPDVILDAIERAHERLTVEIRRALISKGRELVRRFRAEKPEEPFELFARQQRDFFDIQPHLGDEYQKWVSRNAGRDVSSIADGEFLRELARLEKEWGLI